MDTRFETYEGWWVAAKKAGLSTRKCINFTIEDPMKHYVAFRSSWEGYEDYYGAFSDTAGDGPTGGAVFDSPSSTENEIFGRI
jgi:hypothetical protein